MPLSPYQPRRETAVAESDGSILRVDSERLDKLLTWSQVSDYLQLNMSRQRDLDEDMEWMLTVLKSNLFFKVPPINVEQIFSRLEPQVVYEIGRASCRERGERKAGQQQRAKEENQIKS